MNCLLIDAGNSRIKWRLEVAGAVADEGALSWERWDLEAASRWADYAPQRIILATVAGPERETRLASLCMAMWQLPLEVLSSATEAYGVRNAYEEPERLGIDRWAAMVAAYQRCQDAVLVVDAGSAITCDLINAEGRHLGGMIAPGVAAMGGALGSNGLLAWQGPFSLTSKPGVTTRDCMHAGISHALRGIAGGARSAMTEAGFAEYTTLLCGGDAAYLLPLFDNACLVEGLVFEGMSLLAGKSSMESGEA